MKKWKCTVCGYVHEGEEPPETCPVCSADRSKFVEIPSEEAAPAEPYPPSPPPTTDQAPLSRTYDFVTGQMYKHHIHPISVHVPNGVAPAAVIFLMLSLFFRLDNLAMVAFYNMVFVAVAMPLVLFSGYIDWQKRFGGNLTSLFTIKIICGVVVLLTSVVLVGWRLYDPNVAGAASSSRWMFLFIHLILLGAAGTAGFCGGKLVFNQD